MSNTQKQDPYPLFPNEADFWQGWKPRLKSEIQGLLARLLADRLQKDNAASEPFPAEDPS